MTSSLPRPRKSLGQHFLTDPNIIRKIIALADLRPDETVLEIGPGRGALTGALCRAVKTVVAVEVDANLGEYLSRTFSNVHNLDLRIGDALEFPFESLSAGTVVVANLPYNISTPILFRLLESRHRFDRLILMLQTEVARRLVAKPGGKTYGSLSVSMQRWTVPSLAFTVSPGCFHPPPEVGSAVVKLEVRKDSLIEPADDAHFLRIVRAAFAHRRKTLTNSLRDAGLDPDAITRGLADAGIEGSRRAETLSPDEFVTLARAITLP
ncbi:MAG: ribosomal RNA small subunit methyltransferase A [Nitrospirae bacterium]|nr:ribosomal RNA small subunit methyltransferase A [Nitrospirota bacterium]